MKEELENKIREKYPKMFVKETVTKRDGTTFERNACWEIAVGDGWYDLVDSLCGVIQNEVDNDISQHGYRVKRGEAKEEDKPEQVIPVQIKEKFGGLRFYINGGNERVHGAIHAAESMSYRICENCGNPGKPNSDGWIKVYCDPCNELDKRRREEYNAEMEARAAQYRAERAAKEQTNG
jgi:hypothetical protein